MTSSTDLGDVLGSLLKAVNLPTRPDAVEELARDLSASWFASALAEMLNVDCEDAYLALRTVPDPLLVLLERPQGWTDLSNIVARKLGLAVQPYAPTVH